MISAYTKGVEIAVRTTDRFNLLWNSDDAKHKNETFNKFAQHVDCSGKPHQP